MIIIEGGGVLSFNKVPAFREHNKYTIASEYPLT